MSPDIQSGCRYIITNHKAQTVIDLSGADNKSIIGYTRHGGENQQWEPMQVDDGWVIKNARSGHYLGYEGQADDGIKLVATEKLFVWHIWHDEKEPSAYRISVPNTNKVVDLSDHGNCNPGTPITLWGHWEGLHQVWNFERV